MLTIAGGILLALLILWALRLVPYLLLLLLIAYLFAGH